MPVRSFREKISDGKYQYRTSVLFDNLIISVDVEELKPIHEFNIGVYLTNKGWKFSSNRLGVKGTLEDSDEEICLYMIMNQYRKLEVLLQHSKYFKVQYETVLKDFNINSFRIENPNIGKEYFPVENI